MMNWRFVRWMLLLASVMLLSVAPTVWATPAQIPDRQTVPTRVRTTQPTQPPAPTQRPASPGPVSVPTSPSQPGIAQATASPRPSDTVARPTDTPRATATALANTPTRTPSGVTQSRTQTPTETPTGTLTPETPASSRVSALASATATRVLMSGVVEESFSAPLLLCGGAGLIVLGLVMMFVRGRVATS